MEAPDTRYILVPERVEVVDIFRRSDTVPPIVDEAIGIGARVIWMPLGVVHEEAAGKARRAGQGFSAGVGAASSGEGEGAGAGSSGFSSGTFFSGGVMADGGGVWEERGGWSCSSPPSFLSSTRRFWD